MVGIIQEQHPDRARLFMQWKGMGWPILVDSYNLLDVPYVPITLSIDERGVVRGVHRPGSKPEDLRAFIDTSFDPPSGVTAPPGPPDLTALRQRVNNGSATAWRDYADGLAAWGGQDRLAETIAAYREAVRRDPEDRRAHFRLGVAYRMRYDSDDRQSGDFQNAIRHWQRALDIEPNQYIYRRRIQQYGPRLDKPYPFYDWVTVAREEIRGRGEEPAPLTVEPGGAEFAAPSRSFTVASADDEPDPRGRVLRDRGEFIAVETVIVPAAVAPGASARVHVIFRPISERKAHWNNEAEELAFWIDPPGGWEVDSHYLTLPLPAEPVTQETREIEVEVRAPEGTDPGTARIPAYALYYVCEDINGICMYRRQDVALEIEIRRH